MDESFCIQIITPWEYTKTPTTATFSRLGAQTVAPKDHMPPDWFIQPNRYMNESFLHSNYYTLEFT